MDVSTADTHMVVIKYIVLFMLAIGMAHASEITEAFKAKKYGRIVEIYRANQNKNYSKQELVLIGYSLRKAGFYRQDTKLNIKLIQKEYAKEHKKLLAALKKGDTIDGAKYPEGIKVLYWNLMNDYGKIIEGYDNSSQLIKKDHQHYLAFSKLLSELEFRESTVDKFNDKIVAHIQYLENKVYKFSASFYAQYVSWQNEVTLKGPKTSDLIITNRGSCIGGDVGVENYLWHFYFDGCLLAGAGAVSAASSIVNYQQSNVPAYGIKAGPAVSMIVSSSKSRIGIKLPVIYTLQDVQEPTNNGYSIEKDSPLSVAATLYSRWQFGSWYFNTEFGQYIQDEQTIWALGLGKSF